LREILVSTSEREGFASAQEGGYVVVVDTDIPPELRDEGLARELVHRIQNLRREAGFDIADRITTYWQGDDDVRRVLDAHADYVKGETLSLELREGGPPSEAHRSEQTVDGHEVLLGLVRADPGA
jgi:isoleucyl-tRNA synthetase